MNEAHGARRGWFNIACLYVLCTGLAASAPLAAQVCPDPATLAPRLDGAMAHVRFLADDALEGRAVATHGERCAAGYLTDRFRAYGLRPGGSADTWFHGFPVRTGTERGDGNELSVRGATLSPDAWAPLGFSRAARVSAPTIYAGHGVSIPGTDEDRYTHLDLRGRIAVVEAGDPAGPADAPSFRADPHFKTRVLAGRGAVGVVILLGPDDPVPDLASERRNALSVPAVVVRAAAAARVREAARAGRSATLGTDVRPVHTEARNVVATLEGRDAEAGVVIVGAHYDHLGRGGEGSRAPRSGEVHNGADDNASGTAALLEVARRLAEGPRPERTVVFVAFTGEEQGLWGSARFVRDGPVPLERTVAMLNLDMVGRLEAGPLTVYGVGTAGEWDELLDAAVAALAPPFELARAPQGTGPSDHASFHARGIPVLHFFTGLHPEYHRPDDIWTLIDAEGLEWVTELVRETVARLAGQGGPPHPLTPVPRIAPGG